MLCWTDTSRLGTTRLWSSLSLSQQSMEPPGSDISTELHKGIVQCCSVRSECSILSWFCRILASNHWSPCETSFFYKLLAKWNSIIKENNGIDLNIADTSENDIKHDRYVVVSYGTPCPVTKNRPNSFPGKGNVESKGMRVNMNKTKIMISGLSGECQRWGRRL